MFNHNHLLIRAMLSSSSLLSSQLGVCPAKKVCHLFCAFWNEYKKGVSQKQAENPIFICIFIFAKQKMEIRYVLESSHENDSAGLLLFLLLRAHENSLRGGRIIS